MIWIFKLFCVTMAVVATFTTGVLAQWSIGQRGTREPLQGQNRYVYLVANFDQAFMTTSLHDGV